MTTAPPCPLCDTADPMFYHQDRWRPYWRCRTCALVFVPPGVFVDAATEKARYDQHRNDAADPGYRAFLSRLADPLLERVPARSAGLDFGSGPGPVLAAMLSEAGLDMHLYDKFYAPDPGVWNRRYAFITASEVVEHLQRPRQEFDRCFSALHPGGYLAVMTRWVDDRQAFINSRYIRDPTHVCFYSADTCRWIAGHWGVGLDLPATDVALFRRGAAGRRSAPGGTFHGR